MFVLGIASEFFPLSVSQSGSLRTGQKTPILMPFRLQFHYGISHLHAGRNFLNDHFPQTFQLLSRHNCQNVIYVCSIITPFHLQPA